MLLLLSAGALLLKGHFSGLQLKAATACVCVAIFVLAGQQQLANIMKSITTDVTCTRLFLLQLPRRGTNKAFTHCGGSLFFVNVQEGTCWRKHTASQLHGFNPEPTLANELRPSLPYRFPPSSPVSFNPLKTHAVGELVALNHLQVCACVNHWTLLHSLCKVGMSSLLPPAFGVLCERAESGTERLVVTALGSASVSNVHERDVIVVTVFLLRR